MTEPVFLMGLAIAGGTAIVIVRTIAGAFMARGRSTELSKEHLDQLDELRDQVAVQATQLAELQERVDFTERLLARGGEKK